MITNQKKRQIFPVKLPNLSYMMAWGLWRAWLQNYYADSFPETPKENSDQDRLATPVSEGVSSRTTRGRSAKWESSLPEMVHRLAEAAVWPVWAELKIRGLTPSEPGGVRLMLSPHGWLHIFPLHACRLPEDATGAYLGHAFEICYTPSLSMLRRCVQRKRTSFAEVLLTGNPTQDLPFAEVETEAIGRRYRGNIPLLHGQVKRESVLERAARSHRWHYSGHAIFNPFSPLDSALCLGSRENDDTWLTLRHVFRELDLRGNELTVINGCEGALLRPQPTDDTLSLSTGLLYAGARCVVSTLWAVNDLSSALLSDRFHAELQKGHGPAAALREAQSWLREDIRNGVELRDYWLPPLLALLKDENLKKHCYDEAEKYIKTHQDLPPFESPVHWAPFIASGLAWAT